MSNIKDTKYLDLSQDELLRHELCSLSPVPSDCFSNCSDCVLRVSDF